jgi:hypothetical protein
MSTLCGLAHPSIESFSYPRLDDRLPRNPEPTGFSVKGLDHPGGEVDIDALDIASGTTRCPHVEIADDVFLARVELPVKILSSH